MEIVITCEVFLKLEDIVSNMGDETDHTNNRRYGDIGIYHGDNLFPLGRWTVPMLYKQRYRQNQ